MGQYEIDFFLPLLILIYMNGVFFLGGEGIEKLCTFYVVVNWVLSVVCVR